MATAASRRSSARSRATVVGLAVGVAALAVIALVSFARPRDEHPRRTAVASYLEDVDSIERGLGIELQRVSRVYGAMGDPKVPLGERLVDVRRAERAIRTLEQQTRALEPPPEARSFHAELLALFELQSALAHDATALAGYLPARERAQRRLAAALITLRRSLTTSRAPAAQAAALGRLERQARDAASQLADVPVPDTLQPLLRAEREHAMRVAAVSGELQTAIEKGDATRVRSLLADLAQVTQQVTSKAERDAVLAYNRRLRQVGERQAAVRAALAALDRQLR